MKKLILGSVLLCTMIQSAFSDEDSPLKLFSGEHADARLLILGTFHFKDAGLDGYKPEVDIDILSSQRQQELDALLEQLSAYQPSKVLLECRRSSQETFDERYKNYLNDEYELGSNEVYQVGFKLARRNQLKRVHCVDTRGKNYDDLPDDLDQYAVDIGQPELIDDAWSKHFTALYKHDDQIKARRSLIEHLLYLNSDERLRVGHGHYVLRSLSLGKADEYPKADRLTGWWYNRNIRIFANIIRATEKNDRVVLLIGAGHVPIIRHLADSSPEYDLIEVKDVLSQD